MRDSWLILILGLVVTCLAFGQSTSKLDKNTNPAADEVAIIQAITNWDRGWKEFNAELATEDYADDADWTNAFGRTRKGKTAIREFLTGLFSAPEMRARTSSPSTISIKFVRPDVAVVSSYRETVGQKTASGREYPTRKTHDLRVFTKEKGRWVIVSHLIMDEKESLQ